MGRIWKALGLAMAVFSVTALLWQGQRQREESLRELVRQAEELESAVASLEPKAKAHQRNLAKWYNYSLEQGTEDLEQAYKTILNFGQGRMAVLGIPEWDLKLTIFHGNGGVVNHDPSTPLPIGGRENHTILRISRQFPWRPGQNLYIECLGQRITYRVESVQVMGADWSTERPRSGGQDLLTLVFDRGNTRTLIRCVRSTVLALREKEGAEDNTYFWLGIALTVCAFSETGGRAWHTVRVQRERNCGFSRKNCAKNQLS